MSNIDIFYTVELTEQLQLAWPANRSVTIICHGHSVPAGYFATPVVQTFDAYPHLFHRRLKERFPNAVINMMVTAIGGEDSSGGCERFERDVLSRRPDLVTIDYGLNDRNRGLDAAEKAWRKMIELAQSQGVKVILLTPTHDDSVMCNPVSDKWTALTAHAEQIRRLASEYRVGLADSFAAFDSYISSGGNIRDLLSWPNHPNRKGHKLVAAELMRWFSPSLSQ